MNKAGQIAIAGGALFGTLVVGVMIGQGAPPEPEVKTTTITETTEVEVTPAECIDALDLAEQITQINGAALQASSRTLTAAVRLDTATMEANTAKIRALTVKVGPLVDEYNTTSDACRDSA